MVVYKGGSIGEELKQIQKVGLLISWDLEKFLIL